MSEFSADIDSVPHLRNRSLPTQRRGLAFAATAALVALSASVTHAHGPDGWERPIISLLRHEPHPFALPLVLLFQPAPFVAAASALAWIATKSHRAQLAASGAIGCVAAMIATEVVLKPLVDRQDVHSRALMFPSGHVTAAAALAMFAWFVLDPGTRFRSALVLVPASVSWAVISLGDHYPADTIAGLLVGGLVVYGAVTGARRLTSTQFRPAPIADAVWVDRSTADDRAPVAV